MIDLHSHLVPDVDDGARTLKDFLSALAATRGIVLPDRSLPSALLRPLAPR